MKLDIDTLHHAYLFEGERKALLSELFDFLEKKLKMGMKGNPNFYTGEFDTFTIDDGRMLKEMQANKVADGERKVLVVAFNSITREAQNSLLKIFEEPTERTHFFIITPSASLFLPTLLSRIQRGESSNEKQQLETREGEKFLKFSKGDRVQYIKELMEDISDEKKDKQYAIGLLEQLEVILSSKISLQKATPEDLAMIKLIVKSQDFAHDKSASVKMILENIALSL